jgi:phasin
MNTHAKAKQTMANAAEEIRDMTEKGAERTRESFDSVAAATTETANVIKDYCSTTLQGLQAYNSKIVEFAQANTKCYAEFLQKLSGVKSPSELFEVSTNHTRNQLEMMAEQARQLAELTQKTTLAAAEPLKAGFAKSYARAA